MPQQALFGFMSVTDLEVKVHLRSDGPGGSITARVLDCDGKQMEAQTVLWRKDRDVSDLGMVLKAIAEAFLWGEAFDVSKTLSSACRGFLPEVPAAGR